MKEKRRPIWVLGGQHPPDNWMSCELLGLLLTARRLHEHSVPDGHLALPLLLGEVLATDIFLATRHPHGCPAFS